jgi:hypothetical protein
MIGMPIFHTKIPSVEEIGSQEVVRFSHEDPAEKVAMLIPNWAKGNSTQQLRQRVRQKYTWQAIIHHDILLLLTRGEAV